MTQVWVNKIEINDGANIALDKDEIIIFVGANNVGKSATLREINKKIEARGNLGKVIKDVEIEKEGNERELLETIKSKSIVTNDKEGKVYTFSSTGYSASSLKYYWNRYKEGLVTSHNIFVKFLSAEDRVRASNPPASINNIEQPPKHPIHLLQISDLLENRLCKYFRQAFDTDLVLHRNAGAILPLLVGNKPSPETGEDRLSHSYQIKLHDLETLQNQGDGMRSFVGVILYTFIEEYSILFIDEPEAFLHPPQAYLLGNMIGKDLPKNRQLFLATHSEDFLKGLLNSENRRIKVIRISREGNINKMNVLDNEGIRTVWQDPLLRHSNILNGLFHSKVVICEGDADCRFYSAILDTVIESQNVSDPNILFLHCGGKDRIPTVIKALKKLGVPVNVIADFDILHEQKPLKDIVDELGGNWEVFAKDWNIVKKAIDGKRPELETEKLKKEIEDVFTDINETTMSDKKLEQMRMLLRKASPWANAKVEGKAFVPSGDPTKAFNSLIENSKSIGLYILEVGELECFVKTVGNHGPKWVNEVLQMDLEKHPELGEARRFVKQLV